MLMMLFWWLIQGQSAGYVGCGRGICVKVEDGVEQ